MLRRLLRHRRPLIAVSLLIGAIIGGYAWWHRIPDVSALGPPPKVFHDPRLDTPVTITFGGTPFSQAIQQIVDRVGVSLHLDESLFARKPTIDQPVYFHTHFLSARSAIQHLIWQIDSNDSIEWCEQSDGLHIMSFENSMRLASQFALDVNCITNILIERDKPPHQTLWDRAVNWIYAQQGMFFLGEDTDLLYRQRDPNDYGDDLVWLLQSESSHPYRWRPIADPGWIMTNSHNELTIQALPAQQREIYQAALEIYQGLTEGIDARRSHPPTQLRRSVQAWEKSLPGSIKMQPDSSTQLLRLAERDGVSLSIHRQAIKQDMESYGEKPVWAVDEQGVAVFGNDQIRIKLQVLRTYDISDLIKPPLPPTIPSAFDQLEALKNNIQSIVGRDDWTPIGLVANMDNIGPLLLVRAPLDTHDHLADYLAKLREAKK